MRSDCDKRRPCDWCLTALRRFAGKLTGRAADNIAAHSSGSMVGGHEAGLGGARDNGLGRKVSMQIIRPRLHWGQSLSDTPVSR